MQAYGEQQYRNLNVETADKTRLVIMLYEGAISFLNMAIENAGKGEIEDKCNHINNATDIISELNFALDMEIGGDVATNLRSLYQFMTRHLVQGKLEKDGREKLQAVVDMLTSLLEAWRAVQKDPEVMRMSCEQQMSSPSLAGSRGIRV